MQNGETKYKRERLGSRTLRHQTAYNRRHWAAGLSDTRRSTTGTTGQQDFATPGENNRRHWAAGLSDTRRSTTGTTGQQDFATPGENNRNTSNGRRLGSRTLRHQTAYNRRQTHWAAGLSDTRQSTLGGWT